MSNFRRPRSVQAGPEPPEVNDDPKKSAHSAAVQRPPSRPRRWLRRLAWASLSIVLLLAGAGFSADALLCVDDPAVVSCAIIVLGGSPRNRPARAAELYHLGYAPIVIVTGAGDCQANKEVLQKSGVPESAIIMECGAANTLENALFSAPLLRERNATSALIVTDPHHTRRALRTFQTVVPGVHFRAIPAHPKPGEWRHPPQDERRRAWLEYLKIGWYALRHGVSPA